MNKVEKRKSMFTDNSPMHYITQGYHEESTFKLLMLCLENVKLKHKLAI